ncbi:hypothetical protein BP6252_10533 [Coleophoma cylindrospora]|uniref:Calponin-homology (CH) domain-containing protein n=1 Tax=Coleophoma cylindrospora TaxID=1849047 RepID=A0A3D8QSY1_9HELO|nr:hypothetical protein BP6252_10533 [Coleophoma cylindrospora]
MASVTSLDKDMRKLRLDRYTPQAANEARTFIEESLGERLAPGDLMDALKDGVALCKLVSLAVPDRPLRFKQKAVMPFVQMENISIFLEACKQPPLNLQNHDIFLTVDLFESKDPAQVLQCLGAFSRVAHQLQPTHFPAAIGAKTKSGVMSPQVTGSPYANRGRGTSNASNSSSAYNTSNRPVSALNPTKTGDSNGGRWSPTKSPSSISPGVSSWSKKSDEGATSPAWNIAQYGYMGGASQGNLGVSFGGRRQITSAGPYVPSMAEKEKKRREREAEEERLKAQQEEEEQRKREEQQAEEEQARVAEEARWAEETRKLREQEKLKAEEEKRKWEEEERQWQLEEERRQEEERQAEARLEEERKKISRGRSGSQLQGQYLSQYQAENGVSSESSRIKELERELEQARERERQYERERQAKLNPANRQAVEDHDMASRLKDESKSRNRSRSRPRLPSRKNSDEEWRQDERDYLRKQHATHSTPRPLPDPGPARVKAHNTGPSSRPLPDPTNYAATAKTISAGQNRTERFLASNPAPQEVKAKPTYASELGGFDSVAERDAEDRRRVASQKQTKAGGWASKSLLEREMEMERQRQQEWEESQKETKNKAKSSNGVDGIGGGIGGKWDVNQWTGYTGGDSQNRGGQGIGSGRRQIVGPRPPPGR